MAKKGKIRLLVVEDEQEWRKALRNLYKDVLGESQCEVRTVDDRSEAMEVLEEDHRFDLLSLDINLGEGIKPDNDGVKSDANGMDVLMKAGSRKLVNGIIVVTWAPHDRELSTVIPDGKQLTQVRMALPDIVEKWFPQKNRVLLKHPDISIEQSRDIYGEVLTKKVLHELASSGATLSPPYKLDIKGSEVEPHVVLRGRNVSLTVTKPADAQFLYWLAYARKEGISAITKEMALGIFHGTKNVENEEESLKRKADIAVDGMKRRLRKEGVQVEHLLSPVWGKGWKLKDEVQVKGLGTVDSRPRRQNKNKDPLDLLEDKEALSEYDEVLDRLSEEDKSQPDQ